MEASASRQVSAIIKTKIRVSEPCYFARHNAKRTRLDGVRALGGLTGQHDTVGTIENSVGDVADLSTRGSRVVLDAFLDSYVHSAKYDNLQS